MITIHLSLGFLLLGSLGSIPGPGPDKVTPPKGEVQLPIVAHFAIKWLPRPPKQAMQTLALHASAWLAAIAAVYWLT